MSTPARSTRPTADRKIYFYRVDAGADESLKPRSIDFRPVLQYVDGLPFEQGGGRYFMQSDGSLLCAWIGALGSVFRVQFGTIRRNALPQSEAYGKLKDLALAEEEGLCEVCHICIFPEGVVGMEYNFYGPRASRFPAYLERIAPGRVPEFTLESILRHDMLEKLRSKTGVRAMELKVRRSYIETVKELDQRTGNALEALAEGNDAETIGVMLGPEPYQRVNLADRTLQFIRDMVRRDDLRDNVSQFKASVVEEGSTKVDEINLLQDQLISSRKILRLGERTRVLDSEDAFRNIEDAYVELRQDLLSAPTASVERAPPERT
ncbi:hypothetical protein AB0C12_24930 [Actinoplanes sp. NPDC048967]|uniref:hypothetical protein n=1 Tax=Actinoplanes sp. NPDC048967 TaxID=3155269 RepID=UPI0033F3D0B4